MATKKPMKKPVKRVRRFQDGGEAALKAEGLAISNREAPVGFFERLRMGNIDQEGSEAYNRFGAGRGRMERDAANEAAANRMVDAMNASRSARGSYAPEQLDAEAGDTARMSEMMERGRAEGERDEKRMAPSLAQTQNAAILAAKPSRTTSGRTTGDFTRLDRKALLPSGPNVKFAPGGAGKRRSASTEELAASLVATPRNDVNLIPYSTTPAGTLDGERLPEVTGMSNLEKLIAGTGIAGGALGIATKGKKIYQAGKKAFQNFRSAKDAAKKSPPSDATGVMPSKYIYTGAKKGGMVKKMAHGGSVKSSVSTASKRGDGIAVKGKTKGKIV